MAPPGAAVAASIAASARRFQICKILFYKVQQFNRVIHTLVSNREKLRHPYLSHGRCHRPNIPSMKEGLVALRDAAEVKIKVRTEGLNAAEGVEIRPEEA